MIFLLDVTEHLGDDVAALREAGEALRPGGLCVVTVPALRAFWSYTDVLSHHRRRYRRAKLGAATALARAPARRPP